MRLMRQMMFSSILGSAIIMGLLSDRCRAIPQLLCLCGDSRPRLSGGAKLRIADTISLNSPWALSEAEFFPGLSFLAAIFAARSLPGTSRSMVETRQRATGQQAGRMFDRVPQFIHDTMQRLKLVARGEDLAQ